MAGLYRSALLILAMNLVAQAQVRPDYAYGMCYFAEPQRFHFGACQLENLPDSDKYVDRYRVVFQPQQELAFLPEARPDFIDHVGMLRSGAHNHRDLGGIFWVGSEDWAFLTLVPMNPDDKQLLVQQHDVRDNSRRHYSVSPLVHGNDIVKGCYVLEVGRERNPQPSISAWQRVRSSANPGWERKFFEFLEAGKLK